LGGGGGGAERNARGGEEGQRQFSAVPAVE
jgi:hypothetical protein